MKTKQLKLEGNHGVFWRVRMRKANSGEKNPMFGRYLTGEENGMYGKGYLLTGEKNGMFGKEQWNKGKTKETDDRVKKTGENISKTLKIFYATEEGKKSAKERGKNFKIFFATEEGQKWLDENLRGENGTMYGRTGDKASFYGRHHSEESKQLMSENHLDNSGDKNGMYGKKRPEHSKRISGKNNPNYGKRGEEISMYGRTGEKHPNWQGGLSFFPYCEKFDDDLKERVRNFFNRICFICGMSEAENGQKLSVHHVNYDKMVCCNDERPLFVPLCKSCHAKTHSDRKYWEEFFTASLEYLTDGQCFLPKKENEKLKEIGGVL